MNVTCVSIGVCSAKRFAFFLTVLLALGLFSQLAIGQQTLGSLNGTITDTSGAVVQNAAGNAADLGSATATPVAPLRIVAVALCAVEGSAHRSTDGHRIVVTIAETLSSGPTSFTRDVTLDFLAGAEVSRTIDDVPLAKLGMERTLHLTIGYRSDSIRLEHALLVPGAIPLK